MNPKARFLLLTLLLWIWPPASHADEFPSRTVTMVVPFSPGASNDVIARFLAARLGEAWKQTVVVENRPGAGTTIGTVAVTKAKPNGATLLFVSNSYTTTPATRASLPYDPLKDLVPVAMIATGQMVVISGPRTPMTSLADLVRAAKAQTLFYGTAGVGSSTHFAAELLSDVAGIKMEAVHYKGGTEAMLDLTSGQIDVYVGTATAVLPMILNKMAKPVGIASTVRVAALPGVPTVAEAGLAGAEADVWWGVFAPAGTPNEVTAKINIDIAAVMSTPEAKEFLEKQGAMPAAMSITQFTGHIVSEIDRWKDVARKHNIAAN